MPLWGYNILQEITHQGWDGRFDGSTWWKDVGDRNGSHQTLATEEFLPATNQANTNKTCQIPSRFDSSYSHAPARLPTCSPGHLRIAKFIGDHLSLSLNQKIITVRYNRLSKGYPKPGPCRVGLCDEKNKNNKNHEDSPSFVVPNLQCFFCIQDTDARRNNTSANPLPLPQPTPQRIFIDFPSTSTSTSSYQCISNDGYWSKKRLRIKIGKNFLHCIPSKRLVVFARIGVVPPFVLCRALPSKFFGLIRCHVPKT